MAATSAGKTYHHGDLRNALICAAVDLATEGGPERVVLREAARRVGVSPTAAYRHFDGRGELLRTVRAHARRELAASMERAAAREPGADDPVLAAERRVAALCRGYVGFAVEQPGLYRSAFCVPRPTRPTRAPPSSRPANPRSAPSPCSGGARRPRRPGTARPGARPPPAPPRGPPCTDCHSSWSTDHCAASPAGQERRRRGDPRHGGLRHGCRLTANSLAVGAG
ncbi:TetR/AcrR family transcriptional regulator [Streptomyces diastatochromogenes]|nr:TetR/AcrR family transcriptional regulator [Streptomyces diastatochromogenes]